MKTAKYIITILLFSLLPPLVIHASDLPEQTDATNEDAKKSWGIAPVIVPFYLPDTGFGGAASAIMYWNADRNESRPDTASLTAAYTEKGQFFTGLNVDKYLFNEKLLLTANIGFNDWENTFYGISGQPPSGYNSDFEEKFTTSGINLKGGVAFQVVKNLYIGPQFSFEDTDMDKLEDDGWLIGSGLTGLQGGVVAGPGLSLVFDSRDATFYPGKGIFVELEYNHFEESYGSDFDYEMLKGDLRAYTTIKPGHILAGQIEMEYTNDDVPFYRLPDLSSRGNMRGVESGQYIDRVKYACQAEYRFPVWRRFGGVVFAAAGNGAPETGDLFDDIKFAGGFGARYTVEKQQHINLRFDIGFDEDGEVNVYFTVREAF